MNGVVLDAGVMIDALIDAGERGRSAMRVLDTYAEIHVPGHFYVEIVSSLGWLRRANRSDPGRGLPAAAYDLALRTVSGFPLIEYPNAATLPHLLSGGPWLEFVAVTDGFYVALADQLKVPLATHDEKLATGLAARPDSRVRTVDGRV